MKVKFKTYTITDQFRALDNVRGEFSEALRHADILKEGLENGNVYLERTTNKTGNTTYVIRLHDISYTLLIIPADFDNNWEALELDEYIKKKLTTQENDDDKSKRTIKLLKRLEEEGYYVGSSQQTQSGNGNFFRGLESELLEEANKIFGGLVASNRLLSRVESTRKDSTDHNARSFIFKALRIESNMRLPTPITQDIIEKNVIYFIHRVQEKSTHRFFIVYPRVGKQRIGLRWLEIAVTHNDDMNTLLRDIDDQTPYYTVSFLQFLCRKSYLSENFPLRILDEDSTDVANRIVNELKIKDLKYSQSHDGPALFTSNAKKSMVVSNDAISQEMIVTANHYYNQARAIQNTMELELKTVTKSSQKKTIRLKYLPEIINALNECELIYTVQGNPIKTSYIIGVKADYQFSQRHYLKALKLYKKAGTGENKSAFNKEIKRCKKKCDRASILTALTEFLAKIARAQGDVLSEKSPIEIGYPQLLRDTCTDADDKCIAFIRLLLKCKEKLRFDDINEPGSKKRTALHRVAIEGNKVLYDLLIQYDADPTLKDLDGISPEVYMQKHDEESNAPQHNMG